MKATIMTMGATGASAGAAIGAAAIDYWSFAPTALLALLGAGTALMMRPPKGTKAMAARFWGGSFFGFLLGPSLSEHERFTWLSGNEGLPIDVGSAVAAFLLFFILQITAEVLSSPSISAAIRALLDRKAGGGK